jgi:hypothetical protein
MEHNTAWAPGPIRDRRSIQRMVLPVPGDLGGILSFLCVGDIGCAIYGTKYNTDICEDSSGDSDGGTCDGNGVEKGDSRCGFRIVGRGGGRRHDKNGECEYALVSEDKCRSGTRRTTDDRERRHADGSCTTSSNSASRGDDGRDGGGGWSGHDASSDCDPSGRGPGSGDSCCCGIDSASEEEALQLEVVMELRVNRSRGRPLGRFQLLDQGPWG